MTGSMSQTSEVVFFFELTKHPKGGPARLTAPDVGTFRSLARVCPPARHGRAGKISSRCMEHVVQLLARIGRARGHGPFPIQRADVQK
jgi:hypothetical protein